MLLSNAMMLGLSITDLQPYDLDHCALGCAANAMGMKKNSDLDHFGFFNPRRDLIVKAWPWLDSYEQKYGDYGSKIAVTFNEEVFEYKTMTFEQLVDYVRSVEPKCDCNNFNCSCAKVENYEFAEATV